MSIRVAVFDEDPLAREKILRLLRAEREVEIVGVWAWSGEAAAQAREARPDMIFLNIHASALHPFSVADAMNTSRIPVIVFVTTYDPPLVRTLEEHAMGYLLKPFDADRFRVAFQRARDRVKERRTGSGTGEARHAWRRSPVRTVPHWTTWLGAQQAFARP